MSIKSGEVQISETVTVEITQTGNNITMQYEDVTFVGTLEGNQLNLTYGGDKFVVIIKITVSADGKSMSGTSDKTGACFDKGIFTATKR